MIRNKMKFVRRDEIDREKELLLLKKMENESGSTRCIVLTNKEREERLKDINKYHYGTALEHPSHLKVCGTAAVGKYLDMPSSSSKLLLEWGLAEWNKRQTMDTKSSSSSSSNSADTTSHHSTLLPSNKNDIHLCWSWFNLTPDFVVAVPPLSVLASIKYSHLVYEIQWKKHAESFQLLRPYHCNYGGTQLQGVASIGADVKESLKHFEIMRRKETAHRIGRQQEQKDLKLNVTNEEFFKMHFLQEMTPLGLLSTRLNPGCSIYTHDEIHEITALTPNQPIYETMKHDSTKAMIEYELFMKANHQTKINLVREEAMAIACERVLVPQLLTCHGQSHDAAGNAVAPFREGDMEQAYADGLCWTLTRLSKGWFRKFGLLHYDECKHCPKDDLVHIFVNDGRLSFLSSVTNRGNGGSGGDGSTTHELLYTDTSEGKFNILSFC